jgi:hypothetical protein
VIFLRFHIGLKMYSGSSVHPRVTLYGCLDVFIDGIYINIYIVVAQYCLILGTASRQGTADGQDRRRTLAKLHK